MAATRLHALLGHLEKLSRRPCEKQRTDLQLLDDFAACQDETAFTELVSRHGPLVLRVCRRVLQHDQNAVDAFQATFLVLAQRLGTIRKRDSLTNWLYGVAYRTAMKAKRSAARRRNHETRSQERTSSAAIRPSWDDVQAILDEEIEHLPATFRSAFVLCVLEGKTVPAAAAELQCKEGTVSSRLTRARQRLQKQLARRDIQLPAVLAALSVAEHAPAAVPSKLALATVRFGLLVAAGKTVGEGIPSHVSALAAGVTRAMLLSRAKIATILLLAVGLFASGAGMLTHQASAAKEMQPPDARRIEGAGPGEDAKPKAAEEDKDTVTYAGRVLDSDGKPIAGAKLYLVFLYPMLTPQPISVRGMSDPEGFFRFTASRKEFAFGWSHMNEPWNSFRVVASAEGYGISVPPMVVGTDWKPVDLTLQLSKDDVPATGRILDLQGQPVAGVRVKVQEISWPLKGDLGPFLHDLREKKLFYPPLREHVGGFVISGLISTLFPVLTTVADGRFHIKGIGRERLVRLLLEGPSIVTEEVYLTTRPGATIRVPAGWHSDDSDEPFVVHGAGFDHVVAPCKPVVGIIRDKDTGKPIPGAIVTSYQRASKRKHSHRTDLQAVADQDGRYRLTGLSALEGHIIRAGPSEDQPYLMTLQRLDKTPGLEPITADFNLKRGLWITGKVSDKVTGKPVHAHIEYVSFEENPHVKEVPSWSVNIYQWNRPEDGTFRLVGLPGRGLIGARGVVDRYRVAVGADKDGLFRTTVPHRVIADNYHTLIELNPTVGPASVTCDILLDPGQTLTGTILDPDGNPLAGALMSGVSFHGLWEHEPQKTAQFTVIALEPGQSRLLQFFHKEKQLTGFLQVKGDEEKPLTVQLGPSGTLTGRFVTGAGKPMTEGEIQAEQSLPMAEPGVPKLQLSYGNFPGEVRPDRDGKFRIEGLAPGLDYKLGLLKGFYLHSLGGAAADKVSIKAGETKDLGDVEVKPSE